MTRQYTPAETKAIRAAWERFRALAERFGDFAQLSRIDDALNRDKQQRRPPVSTSKAVLTAVAERYLRGWNASGLNSIDPDLCDSALVVAAVAIRIRRNVHSHEYLPAFLLLADACREAEGESYARLVARIDEEHPPVG